MRWRQGRTIEDIIGATVAICPLPIGITRILLGHHRHSRFSRRRAHAWRWWCRWLRRPRTASRRCDGQNTTQDLGDSKPDRTHRGTIDEIWAKAPQSCDRSSISCRNLPCRSGCGLCQHAINGRLPSPGFPLRRLRMVNAAWVCPAQQRRVYTANPVTLSKD